MDEIVQLYTNPVGLPIQQASGQDSAELRCPSCETELYLETIEPICPYCGFNLKKWSTSDSNITQTNFVELHQQDLAAEGHL